MYVCICHAITDRQVRAAFGAGVREVDRLHPHYGCETQCGRCLDMISDMLDVESTRAAELPPQVAA